jgi:5'-nucleotidase
MLNILVTNDDGITAPGLWALARELKSVAEVIVVAPDREQSGVGTSITLHQPLRVRPAKSAVTGVEAYSVEGTPADSVIIGTRMLWEDRVDLVISGINEGPNLGKDVLVSGTVGAAFQAHNCGLPAIALSVFGIENMHFEVAAKIGSVLAQQVSLGYLPDTLLLNVNLPNVPIDQITGIDITQLGRSGYTEGLAVTRLKGSYDTRRDYCWIVPNVMDLKEEPGTDILALKQNRISITPIDNNVTSRESPESLKQICSALSDGLSSGSLKVSNHFGQ